MLVQPGAPLRLIARHCRFRGRAEEVEIDRGYARLAEGHGIEHDYAGSGLVEVQEKLIVAGVASEEHGAGDGRYAGERGAMVAYFCVREVERDSQGIPGFIGGRGGEGEFVDGVDLLVAVVGENQFEYGEEGGPAGFGAGELIVPVVSVGEQALHYTDDAGAAGFRLDEPLEGHRGGFRTEFAALLGGVMRRIPGGDGGVGLHAGAEVERHFAADAFFRFRGHEPRGDSVGGINGAPDFFGRARNLHFDLDGTASVGFFFDWHLVLLIFCLCGTLWERLRDGDQTVRAARGRGFVVVPRNKRSYGVGELLRESGAVGGGTKTDDGVDGKRRKALVEFGGAAKQIADFAHDARSKRDQVAGREAVGPAGVGVGADWAHRGWRDHIRRCGGDEQAFGEPAPLAFSGDAHESVRFKGAKMVAEFLTGNFEAGGKHGSRSGLEEFREEARANWVEGHGGGGGIVNDFDGKHGGEEIEALTIFIVNSDLSRLIGEGGE